MKLCLYTSNTTNGAVNACMGAAAQSAELRSVIVIVPDRFSLSVERDIFSRMKRRASFNTDVVSFSRFAVKTVGKKGLFLSKEGTVMLLKKTVNSISDKLTYFKNTASVGFVRELFAAIASFRTSGVTPAALYENANSFGENRKDKYTDIALIYEAYEKLLAEKYVDTVSRIDSLLRSVKTDERIARSDIFIVGFNIFSVQQRRLINELAVYANSVNISCAVTDNGENGALHGFSFRETLLESFKQAGIAAEERYFFERLLPPFDTLNTAMFSLTGVTAESRGRVKLYKTASAYEEIKLISREIVYLVRNGYRFSEIAVVCCDENYKRYMKELFPRFEIPYFIDETYPASNGRLCRFIFTIFELNLDGFRREDALKLIKHPYMKAEAAETGCFENYCLKYNINRSRFLSPFVFGDCAAAEKVRTLLDDPVFILKGGTLGEIMSQVKNAAEKYYIAGEESADPLESAGAQCEDKVFALFDEIISLIGDEKCDMAEAYSIFSSGAANLECALAPQKMDTVFVGNTSESRYSSLKALFIAGAADGCFPFVSQEQTIVSNADLYFMEKAGITVQPTPLESNRLEQFVITDLICRAERLYAGYSEYSDSGEKRQPGEGLKELSAILALPVSPQIRSLEGEEKLLYELACEKNAFYEYCSGGIEEKYISAVKKYLEDKGYDTSVPERINRIKAGDRLFTEFFEAGGETVTKVSQLEKYLSCPYSHFLSYGLNLKERDEPALRVLDAGNIIHGALELFFKETLHKLSKMSDEETEKTAVECTERALSGERLAALAESETEKNAVSTIRNECVKVIKILAANVKNSMFEPEFIEMSFGMGGAPPLVIFTKYGGIKVRGKVDRVDVCGNKAIIIDYKTGNADKSDSFPAIYYGKKIQLYIYLRALTDMGYVPAGAFYLPINDKYSVKGNDYKFIGQLENSLETVGQLDLGFSERLASDGNASCTVFNARATAKGALRKSASLIDRADFYNLSSYAVKLAEKTAEEIIEGNIAPSPLAFSGKPCEFCPYVSLCAEDEVEKRKAGAVSLDAVVKSLLFDTEEGGNGEI